MSNKVIVELEKDQVNLILKALSHYNDLEVFRLQELMCKMEAVQLTFHDAFKQGRQWERGQPNG